ncbi:MAG: hypothetical protein NW224_08635 [Leptolyngbyaceae cyanobacterium bins.302]|nr:hypothetical protein [Leptolyngbyaceae cyanobacterium bins.302]
MALNRAAVAKSTPPSSQLVKTVRKTLLMETEKKIATAPRADAQKHSSRYKSMEIVLLMGSLLYVSLFIEFSAPISKLEVSVGEKGNTHK